MKMRIKTRISKSVLKFKQV